MCICTNKHLQHLYTQIHDINLMKPCLPQLIMDAGRTSGNQFAGINRPTAGARYEARTSTSTVISRMWLLPQAPRNGKLHVGNPSVILVPNFAGWFIVSFPLPTPDDQPF